MTPESVASSLQRLVASVEQLTAAVRRLEAALPRGQERQLRQRDGEALAALLPATPQGHVFSTAELLEHAALHPELLAAIQAATGRPPAAAAKALGKLLRRSLGVKVAGLQVHRVGVFRGAALWVVSSETTNVGLEGDVSHSKPTLAATARGRSPTTAAP